MRGHAFKATALATKYCVIPRRGAFYDKAAARVGVSLGLGVNKIKAKIGVQ